MTGITGKILGGITLVAPTIKALIDAAGVVKSSWDLFQRGDITKDELQERFRAAGVKVQDADANLQDAMDEALEKERREKDGF